MHTYTHTRTDLGSWNLPQPLPLPHHQPTIASDPRQMELVQHHLISLQQQQQQQQKQQYHHRHQSFLGPVLQQRASQRASRRPSNCSSHSSSDSDALQDLARPVPHSPSGHTNGAANLHQDMPCPVPSATVMLSKIFPGLCPHSTCTSGAADPPPVALSTACQSSNHIPAPLCKALAGGAVATDIQLPPSAALAAVDAAASVRGPLPSSQACQSTMTAPARDWQQTCLPSGGAHASNGMTPHTKEPSKTACGRSSTNECGHSDLPPGLEACLHSPSSSSGQPLVVLGCSGVPVLLIIMAFLLC